MIFIRQVVTGLTVLGLLGASLPLAMADDSLSDGKKTDSKACTVAIDPGHNIKNVEEYDPITGVYMYDYPNGQEIYDVWEVSETVKAGLEKDGFNVVMLRDAVDTHSTYRDKVDLAKSSGADVAVSIHTTPGANYSMIIAQKDGGFRNGTVNGEEKKVVFKGAETAEKSQKWSKIMADERTKHETSPVRMVSEHSFGGRAPLWGGNTPVLSLLSEDVPWLYNEFGTANGGGAEGISDAEKASYSKGLIAGIEAALDGEDCGGGKTTTTDKDDSEDKVDKEDKEDSKVQDDSNDNKNTDKPKVKEKKLIQWLGYYDSLNIIGDELADSLASEKNVKMWNANGLKNISISSTENAPVDKIVSGINQTSKDSDAVVVAISAKAYESLRDRNDEVAVINAILDAAQESEAKTFIWVKPIVLASDDQDTINHIKEIHQGIKRVPVQNMKVVETFQSIGENGASDSGLLNKTGKQKLGVRIGTELASSASNSGYKPESVSVSSASSKAKTNNKSDSEADKPKTESKDEVKDESKDDDKADKDKSVEAVAKQSPEGTVSEKDWDLLAQCEAGGNWEINTGNGYSGGLQFAASTWTGHGGSTFAPVAHQASKLEQMEVANNVLKGQGWGAWPACTSGQASAVKDKKPAPEGTFAELN